MIYFDNAATGGFKPFSVLETTSSVMKYLTANPGRSGHRLSVTGAEIVWEARKILGEFFNADPDRVIFTKNCTEALNTAIFGSLKIGGHVITTTFEHSSVLRPLFTLYKEGLISLDIVCPSEGKPLPQAIEEKICEKTYMICMTSVSNVTGEELPVSKVGEIAKKHGLIYLVDGAQGGGHIPLDLKKQNVSLLALAGHKGLYGVMGSGALILGDGVDIKPLTVGGTGTESSNLLQPENYPEKLEAGTLNLPAISSLLEGVKYVRNNFDVFAETLVKLTSKLIEGLNGVEKVKCYSKPNPSGIVAFKIDTLSSEQVADILNSDYDIAVRGSYHCAYKTHEFLGTEDFGLVRASLSHNNSESEVRTFIRAVKNISENS